MRGYNHQEVEKRIYHMWEESGYFTPKMEVNKKPFVIVLTPPNASGAMHLGNVFDLILHDVLIRYHRMKGEPTLFLPGTDHGGYETQITYEQELAHQGKTSSGLIRRETRSELYEKLSRYVQNNNEQIKQQLKALGASVDWSRFHFTLDKQAVQSVYATFRKLDQDGLISRNKRNINYCPKCETTLPDIEIDVRDKIKVCKAGHAVETQELPIWCVLVDAPQKSLKRAVVDAIQTGEIKILTLSREDALKCAESIQDWYIARQNVWGIRIPVWYEVTDPSLFTLWFLDKHRQRQEGTLKELLEKGYSWDEIEQGLERVQAAENATYVLQEGEKKEGVRYLPETDTFDTWFSSSQWGITTLKDSGLDFTYFYPTSVRVSGRDLRFVSVPREIMLAYYLTGKPPFSQAYLHRLVLGANPNPEKMSKSLGNAVYPERYIRKFGADALRMTLVSYVGKNRDFLYPEEKTVAYYQHFSRIIWNLGQHIDQMEEEEKSVGRGVPLYSQELYKGLGDEDKEIIASVKELTVKVTDDLENHRFTQAQERIRKFVLERLSDTFVNHVQQKDKRNIDISVLRYVYLICVTLLHPFMPFMTEEIYGTLIKSQKPLIISDWPQLT